MVWNGTKLSKMYKKIKMYIKICDIYVKHTKKYIIVHFLSWENDVTKTIVNNSKIYWFLI